MKLMGDLMVMMIYQIFAFKFFTLSSPGIWYGTKTQGMHPDNLRERVKDKQG